MVVEKHTYGGDCFNRRSMAYDASPVHTRLHARQAGSDAYRRTSHKGPDSEYSHHEEVH